LYGNFTATQFRSPPRPRFFLTLSGIFRFAFVFPFKGNFGAIPSSLHSNGNGLGEFTVASCKISKIECTTGNTISLRGEGKSVLHFREVQFRSFRGMISRDRHSSGMTLFPFKVSVFHVRTERF